MVISSRKSRAPKGKILETYRLPGDDGLRQGDRPFLAHPAGEFQWYAYSSSE